MVEESCEHAKINDNKYTEHQRCVYGGDCRYQISYVGESYCKIFVNPQSVPEPRASDFGLSRFEKLVLKR